MGFNNKNEQIIMLNQLLSEFKKGQLSLSEEDALKFTRQYPGFIQAWKLLGLVYVKQKKYSLSISSFKKGLEIDPLDFDTNFYIALMCSQEGDYDGATWYFYKAISIEPNSSIANYHLGIAYIKKKDLRNAIKSFNNSIKLNNQFINAYYYLGLVHAEIGEYEEAINNFKKTILLDKNFIEGYMRMGLANRGKDSLKESISDFYDVLKINKNYHDAYVELGVSFYYNHELDKSIKYLKSSLNLKKKNTTGIIFLLRILLSQDQFDSYGNVIEKICRNFYLNIDQKRNNPWNCDQKKTVLIKAKHCDVGDHVIYSSMLNEISEASKKLVVECDKRFIPLFRRSFSDEILFIDNIKKYSHLNIDHEIPSQETLFSFRKNITDYQKTYRGFLKPNLTQVTKIKKILSGTVNKKIVGVSWKTINNSFLTKYRNIDLLELVQNLDKKNIELVNLQYGPVVDEIKLVKNELNVDIKSIEEIDNFNDLDGLCSLIAACDVVITSQNITAHLAGALGVDTRLLLSYISLPFWGYKNNYSHFYQSVKIYRQEKNKSWHEPIELLNENL